MAREPKNVSLDAWLPVMAKVIACRVSWLRSGPFDLGGVSEYFVSYVYVVGGSEYRGRHLTTQSIEPGGELQTFYNPEIPSQNSGDNGPTSGPMGWMSALFAAAVVVALYAWAER